ncbi:MAG TPA: DUF1425 domain-containing protein [Phycisphaerae bacterium]|jgi:uncharacterized protein YcfL|nr:hypothetical protein [Phycisphaerae bacterium]HOB73543.1 DUF1425 domain-containing protein [Phycisphaerae bacterium]HOJ54151.1 DUF1425 domain-containing protein [Phycisphaerae bacterium]HOL25556.1 DUF1425 domain-containing protein [Phycisphaerae bacterium]HPP21011.1 DUF1425 domain-containing protein [Phycisphaerae bacterium]
MRSGLSFLAVLPLLLSGCASTHQAKDKGIDDPYHQKGRIQWNSSNIRAVLQVDKVVSERTETGLLRVRMIIRNKTRDDIWVDIRTLFTDEQGFEKEKTNWEPICCTARTQTTYEAVSLGAQVCDYQVIIRDPKTHDAMP